MLQYEFEFEKLEDIFEYIEMWEQDAATHMQLAKTQKETNYWKGKREAYIYVLQFLKRSNLMQMLLMNDYDVQEAVKYLDTTHGQLEDTISILQACRDEISVQRNELKERNVKA